MVLLTWTILVVVACAVSLPVGAIHVTKYQEQQERIEYCRPLQQQRDVDLTAISGFWHAVETIGHRNEDRNRNGLNYQVIPLCPLMYLNIVENTTTDLRLRWEEPIGVIEYRFRVVNPDVPGVWMSMGQQNGSMVENSHNNYRQFAGMVYVMRAVSEDMILTFCSPQTHHYSMIMSRNNTMDDEQLHRLNKMLEDRSLPLANTRVACRGSAGSIVLSAVALVLALAHGLLILAS